MSRPKNPHEKWFEHREDLTGEHSFGDAGQAFFGVLFFGVWISDSFFLRYTTQLHDVVPSVIRKPVAIVLLCLAAYCACSGLIIVFGKVRKTPSVIRKHIFRVVRHPIYLSEVLLYLGLFLMSMSLAAGIIGLAASFFLYFLSRYEERLLLERFGDDYRSYMHDVGMWLPKFRRHKSG